MRKNIYKERLTNKQNRQIIDQKEFQNGEFKKKTNS